MKKGNPGGKEHCALLADRSLDDGPEQETLSIMRADDRKGHRRCYQMAMTNGMTQLRRKQCR